MKKEELKVENEKLKRIVKEQKRVIDMLSNEEIVIGLKNAVEDFKHGRYEIIKNY